MTEEISREEYAAQMLEVVKGKLDGKTVTVPLDFLYQIGMFLEASSHLEDEGRLPYPSFQNLSHELGYQIREYTKEHIKFFPLDCYITYDQLWKEYNEKYANDEQEFD